MGINYETRNANRIQSLILRLSKSPTSKNPNDYNKITTAGYVKILFKYETFNLINYATETNFIKTINCFLFHN